MKLIARISALAMFMGMVACGGGSTDSKSDITNQGDESVVVEPEYLYGIDIAGYNISNDTVRSGETVGGILNEGIAIVSSAVGILRFRRTAHETGNELPKM